MEEEKKAQSKEELTDETLDTVSGGVIVKDDLYEKYTVYDEKNNKIGTENSYLAAVQLARDNNVSEKCVFKQDYNFYLKTGIWPTKDNFKKK